METDKFPRRMFWWRFLLIALAVGFCLQIAIAVMLPTIPNISYPIVTASSWVVVLVSKPTR